MTLAKAQACMVAISGAGFDAEMRQSSAGNWVVRASSAALNIQVGAADSLAIAQAVTGNISLIEYS